MYKKKTTQEAVLDVLIYYSNCLLSLQECKDLKSLAKKLFLYGITVEMEKHGNRIGFGSFYCNDNNNYIAFLTRIAVLPQYEGKGYGTQLLKRIEEIAFEAGMKYMRLEVNKTNERAMNLYNKMGYVFDGNAHACSCYMIKVLQKGD